MANQAQQVFPPRWSDPFEVPASLVPEGMSFQWCVKRADSTGERDEDYEKMLDAGWVLVPRQWLPGRPVMIAGNDLICRPKWMTERALKDSEQKAHKQVDDWMARTGAVGISGGVRVWTGDASRSPKVWARIGDHEEAQKLIDASRAVALPQPKVDPLIPVSPPEPKQKSHIPRRPWLRWLFNLISTEAES